MEDFKKYATKHLGMNSMVLDDVLANYAAETLKKKENMENLVNRAIEVRLAAALKQTVKLDEKSVSLEEFNKMFE